MMMGAAKNWRRGGLKALLVLIALLSLSTADFTLARAALQLRVDQGVTEPIPIAIPDFLGATPQGREIAGVVRADLERSGLFRALNPASFIEKVSDINVPPRFADWRTIKAQGLVTGQAVAQPDGRMRVEFRLWDTFAESQMVGLQYNTTMPESWRQIAHMVSDSVYEKITGEKGYFNTRIVFIDEDDARIEIAFLAGDLLVDGIGDHMSDLSPALGHRGVVLEADHLALRESVPEPELDTHAPVRLRDRLPGYEPLRLDGAPVGETRWHVDVRDLLDERRGIERAEKA